MKSSSYGIFILILVVFQVSSKNYETQIENIFVEKSIGPITYSISSTPNPLLAKILPGIVKNDKCKEKTGVLNLMNALKKNVLQVKPSFISLTKLSINLFNSLNKNSLITSILLPDIQRITQHYPGTNCFDIMSKHNNVVPKQTTLCAKNKIEFNQWISAILEFKKCEVTVVKINALKVEQFNKNANNLKNFGTKILNPMDDQINKLKYDTRKGRHSDTESNSDSESNSSSGGFTSYSSYTSTIGKNSTSSSRRYRSRSSSSSYSSSGSSQNRIISKDLVRREVVSSKLTDLIKTIKKGEFESRKVKQDMVDKLEGVTKVKEIGLKKEEEIRQMLEQRSVISREKEESLIKLAHQHKEVRLIKKAQKKLKKIRSKEIRETKKHFLNQINYHKLEAQKQAQTVLKLIQNQNKLNEWTHCSNKKLTGFKDSKYVSGLCKLYYGENGQPKCIQKKYFCGMCCRFNIGLNHMPIRKKCVKKCDKLINTFTIPDLNSPINKPKKSKKSKSYPQIDSLKKNSSKKTKKSMNISKKFEAKINSRKKALSLKYNSKLLFKN